MFAYILESRAPSSLYYYYYILESRPRSGLIWKCATALTFEKLAQELAASLMAASILSGANFDVRPAEMEKEVASLFARSLCARSLFARPPALPLSCALSVSCGAPSPQASCARARALGGGSEGRHA